MRLKLQSFRTKVGKRIFSLFIICALVPVSALALFSYSHVTNQLQEQGSQRLKQECKSLVVSITERLLVISAQIQIIAAGFSDENGALKDNGMGQWSMGSGLGRWFSHMAIIANGGSKTLFGEGNFDPRFTSREAAHLQSGKILIRMVNDGSPSGPKFHIFSLLSGEAPSPNLLAAEINSQYVWEAAEGRPSETELVIMDSNGAVLFSTFMEETTDTAHLLKGISNGHSGQFEWVKGDSRYLASFNSIFLKPNFFSPEWRVILVEPKSHIFAPMKDFRLSFPVWIIFSLALVVFLSMSLIRKSLGPIESLKAATEKIANGDFGHTVNIQSGDEFESLGRSFNTMSRKLDEDRSMLIKAARMATMGQMAAGVFHEVKQPLSSIYGLIQLILLDAKEPESRTQLEAALRAVERLNTIIDRFKSFSPSADEMMRPVSLADIIEHVHMLFLHELRSKHISIVVTVAEKLPQVYGNSHGIEQVFSNLLINAMHALEGQDETDRKIVLRSYVQDDAIIVEFGDNGCGMKPEVVDSIFDPFFTTKAPGKGTGLGMAITESILHKHRASIRVESKVDVGTTFILSFPPATNEVNHENSA